MIIPKDKIQEILIKVQEDGFPNGAKMGMPDFDKHLTFLPGTCTDIGGWPFRGKSLIAKEIAVAMAVRHKWKVLLFMPDDGDIDEVASNIVNKFTGKTFFKGKSNTISQKEVVRYLDQIWDLIHFYEGNKHPEAIWKYAVDNNYNLCLIDSWNKLSHPEDYTKPSYLRKTLDYRNELIKGTKTHLITCVHPRSPESRDWDKDGNLKMPDITKFQGGSEWDNFARNVIIVHKDNKEDYSEHYRVHVDKIKPKYAGKLGEFRLGIDWDAQRMYQTVNDNYGTATVYYAYEQTLTQAPAQKQLTDFIEPHNEEPF